MNTAIWIGTGTRRTLIGAAAVQVEPFPGIDDEPVTVAEVVRQLKWPTGTPDEADVPRWIAAARTMIERDTGLALVEQTWDLFLDTWGTVPGFIRFPLAPVTEVVEVVVVEDDATETALDVADYLLVDARPARVSFRAVPSLAAARANLPIRIRYTAGMAKAAIPPDLVHALLLQVADFAMHRGDEREGVASRTVSAARALIERHIPAEVI